MSASNFSRLFEDEFIESNGPVTLAFCGHATARFIDPAIGGWWLTQCAEDAVAVLCSVLFAGWFLCRGVSRVQCRCGSKLSTRVRRSGSRLPRREPCCHSAATAACHNKGIPINDKK